VPIAPPEVPTGSPTTSHGLVSTSEVPIVRIEPVYPRRPLASGIEGWVEVQFTITGAGTVTDVAVIDADPKGVFDDAATSAVRHWKYSPRVEDGRATERRGVRVLLRFDLK
jgi:protein TonB